MDEELPVPEVLEHVGFQVVCPLAPCGRLLGNAQPVVHPCQLIHGLEDGLAHQKGINFIGLLNRVHIAKTLGIEPFADVIAVRQN